jgi:hypothetical protein
MVCYQNAPCLSHYVAFRALSCRLVLPSPKVTTSQIERAPLSCWVQLPYAMNRCVLIGA